MKLEVNSNHKKVNLRNILSNITPRRLKSGIAALFISGSLVLGVKNEAYAEDLNPSIEYSETINDIQVIIPDGENKREIYNSLNKPYLEEITISDLKKINTLSINTDEDISFLKYCTNLESLSLKCSTYEGIKNFDNIPSSNKLKTIALACSGAPISKNHANFLINSPNISYLYINNSTIIEDGVLGNMQNLNSIELFSDYGSEGFDTNLKDLVNIKTLKNLIINTYSTLPLNLAISLDTATYNTLKNNGVNIDFGNNSYIYNTYGKTSEELFLEINKELDNIVKSLNIDESSSDIEKYNEVLLYVIERLTYDPQVYNLVKENKSYNDKQFYDIGTLQGALMNDTAICGNYTALLNALCKRVGLEAYSVVGRVNSNSGLHSWSLVKINNEYYYADATGFDSEAIMVASLVDENGKIIMQIDSKDEIPYNQAIMYTFSGSDIDSKRNAIKDGTINNYSQYLIDMSEEERIENIIPIEFEDGVAKYIKNEISTAYDTQMNNDSKENNNIEELEVIDITNKKFKINLSGKIFLVSAPIFISILSIFGLIKKKKMKKAREVQFDAFSDDFYNNNFYTDDFNSEKLF